MQKATNKEKSLFGVLRTVIQEALNWIETQRCCEQNKRWGVGKAVEEDSSEKLHRLLFTDLLYTPVGIQPGLSVAVAKLWSLGHKKKKTKKQVPSGPRMSGSSLHCILDEHEKVSWFPPQLHFSFLDLSVSLLWFMVHSIRKYGLIISIKHTGIFLHAQLCLTLCNPKDCQAPLSMGLSWQE